MAQQMINGSHYSPEGSETITHRMSDRYAVVGAPYAGKHLKPQDEASLHRRKMHWQRRKLAALARGEG